MSYADFERLLKASIGVEAVSIGASTIARAVRERQRACNLSDLSAYWGRVSGSDAERQALVEAVVVPETWFFRDRKAFAALGGVVREEWCRANPNGVLRMLSLPCSTGEEPYSMAMTMLDEGLPADRFHVDAVDVSARALAHARRGVYGKGAFRGQYVDFRDRHFKASTGGHVIDDAVRRQVTFQQGNLVSPTFLPGAAIYDVVFCRNVLIYFGRAIQDRAMGVLARLLRPHGWLFVGSSETGVLQDHGFASARLPMAFAFRKAGAVPRKAPPVVMPSVRKPSGQPPIAATPAVPNLAPSRRTTAAPEPGPRAASAGDLRTGLDEATELANQGRLAEAAIRCREHLRQGGPSAEAFCLLGLVHDAAGRPSEAAACYRKALYLDPHHRSTLMHFALLMEKLDKKTEAHVLRTRARRLVSKAGVR